MPHIKLPEAAPGLIGPLQQYPETAGPLAALAESLLRGPSPLSTAEREVIAAYVSDLNACFFCAETHSATARELLGRDASTMDQVLADGDRAAVDGRLRALLTIAGKVRESGRAVTDEDVARARAEGADDRAIHDTVLIAAAFAMFNRYVDGLATWAPTEPDAYRAFGVDLAAHGYLRRISERVDAAHRLWPAGASEAYVTAQSRLLAEERALRDHLERVATARRSLPPGAPLDGYLLDGDDGQIRLVDLFGEHDTLVVYHLMFPPGAAEACPMCSMWVDGFHGVSHHLTRNMSFAVVAKAPLDELRGWAYRRGWDGLRMLSSYHSSFNVDLGVEDPDGSQRPAISVFVRAGDEVRHAYTMQAGFSESEPDRGIDLLSPVWQVLDLLPKGRNDWWAGNGYAGRARGGQLAEHLNN